MTRHPAKFTDSILVQAADTLECQPTGKLLDPFAGTGKGVDFMASRGWDAHGVEIEPEWASISSLMVVGDATNLPFPDECFDVIFTSPCYGNRMADHHEPGPSDTSTRNTYRHALERPLSPRSLAGVQWGPQYRRLHTKAWYEAFRVTKPGGHFLLNIKDHIRKGTIQPVTTWHIDTLVEVGYVFRWAGRVPTRGNRQGANGELRVDGETLALFRKP